MRLKTSVAEIVEDGDYCFRDVEYAPGVVGRNFVCQIPGGDIIAVPIHTASEKPKRPVSWQWNGSEDRPTLTPSLLVQGVNAWHGFVTDGQLRTC